MSRYAGGLISSLFTALVLTGNFTAKSDDICPDAGESDSSELARKRYKRDLDQIGYEPLVLASQIALADTHSGSIKSKINKDFWKRIHSAANILRRVHESTDVTQTIVLCAACVESLIVSKSSDDSGITHQIAYNSAALLSNDADQRGNAIDKIKKMYRVRSDIVHGNMSGLEAQFEEANLWY